MAATRAIAPKPDEKPDISDKSAEVAMRAPRRRPRAWRWADVGEFAGSAASALLLTWLIFDRFLPFRIQGVAFAVAWYALTLPIYWLVVRDGHGPVAARDRLASILITTGAALALSPIFLVVGYVTIRGLGVIDFGFLTETMELTGPLSEAGDGGLLHSLVGTLQQLGIATLIAVPLGVLTAVYLSEITGPLARPTRLVADAMTALPSIVAGLFVYSIVVIRTGWGFSGFAGSLALTILMLPTVTIAAEQVLRVVPGSLREAALALGSPYWRSVLLVVLPTARAGLATAVILGMARVVGETAPVLLTVGGTNILNVNPFSDYQDNIPLFVFNQIRSSKETFVERAWGGALLLLILVLVLFVLARLAGGAGPGGKSRRRRGAAK
ncbi:phosphate transport system permease protein PstA [Acrocarpospora phusangensis]|uniref:Phosphate transport system permease protein PstA n=1 Tax=Acrocarpospora phusangensis TaxID=1070424 RepID=A0A919Q3W0_9ACTN|nr:phosphate ABC transporter permease PstA [Acrocarpospora phusangensis]GIH21832.1 phosphate transport system permease protein PstA [Acrocarpospora phusangensis]